MKKTRTYNDIWEKSHWNDKKSISVLKNKVITERDLRRLRRLIYHMELLRKLKVLEKRDGRTEMNSNYKLSCW